VSTSTAPKWVDGVNAYATLSACGLYRYRLVRILDMNSAKVVGFVGLNPSTADAVTDDATIRKCTAYAKSWGFGAFVMFNLFAYRSRDPLALRAVADPVGPENNRHLHDAEDCQLVVACWGTKGGLLDRDRAVLELFRSARKNLAALRVTKHGHPEHPLYLPGDLTPQPWKTFEAAR
jgi:hypothetical protein